MVRGLYTAYTGMANEQKRLDVITNNLANSATVGFKKEGVTNQAFDEVLTAKIRDGSEAYVNQAIGSMSLGVKIGEVYTDYGQGAMRSTGNSYDLAIEGEGFFKVRMNDDSGTDTFRYTRNGSFKVDTQGYVRDEDGNYVQGASGDLQVPAEVAENVAIDAMGNIFVGEEVFDTVSVVDFEDYDYLKKLGSTMYEPVEGANEIEAAGWVRQGFTEQSNVNSISEMVQMITITRAYEANQKVIQSIDSMLDKSVNQIARV